MRSRLVHWRYPAVFPALSVDASEEVWGRAAMLDEALDFSNDLTRDEREALLDDLREEPRLPALAAAYLAGVCYAIAHPFMAALALAIVPMALLRVFYLAGRSLLT